MFAEDISQNRVGEEATLVGEVRDSVKGVFYDRMGYWLRVKDKSGEAWVFSDRDFAKKTRVKAEGLIEMNYDEPSLISQKIEEYSGELPAEAEKTPEAAPEVTEKKSGVKRIVLVIVVLALAAALVVKFKPDLLTTLKSKIPNVKVSLK